MTWLLLNYKSLWLGFGCALGAVFSCLVQYGAPTWPIRKGLHRLVVLLTLYGVMATAAALPGSVSFVEPPGRAVAPLYFIAFFACLAFGYGVSRSLPIARVTQNRLLIVAIILVATGTGIVIQDAVNMRPIVQEYSAAFDRFYQRGRDAGNVMTTGEFVVDEFPSSGWLHDANPTPDPNHWINRCMAREMGLTIPLRRKSRDETE